MSCRIRSLAWEDCQNFARSPALSFAKKAPLVVIVLLTHAGELCAGWFCGLLPFGTWYARNGSRGELNWTVWGANGLLVLVLGGIFAVGLRRSLQRRIVNIGFVMVLLGVGLAGLCLVLLAWDAS